jgi:hypothetical protein
MGLRLDLHEELCTLLGSRNVYFQPPESIKMEYPAIVYERSTIDTRYANGKPYTNQKGYKVTSIGRDPDSSVPDKLALLPFCRFDRHYRVSNLNHDVFLLYY